MSDKMTAALHQACQMFMYPVAKFLLQHGFRFNDFADAARIAFVQAAEDDEQAVSRIASKTGIPRKDVARCKEEPRINVNQLAYTVSKLAAVFSYWWNSPTYRDADGQACPLSRRKFANLVEEVSPETDVSWVRRELISADAALEDEEGHLQPTRRYFIPRSDDPISVTRYGIRLRDLASTLYRNTQTDQDPIFEASSYKCTILPDEIASVSRSARVNGQSMLVEFDDWLGAQTHSDAVGIRAGVGIYYFEENLT